MLRSTCLLSALSATCIATAQLAPNVPATPGEHLLEVNAQWAVMDPAAIDEARTVQFTSEAERIATHLHRVREHLVTHTPTGIEAAALVRRNVLLDALNAYADRGLFPVNDVVPGRSPVFIDALGTACAVGHLMITSGHADIAERIHREMDLAYVHDIALPEVVAWADAHGFTPDELAWIQPTYAFEDHPITRTIATLELANGDIILVENPASTHTVQKLSLVRRNASGNKLLATLPMLSAVQLVEFDGRVFVAGVPVKPGATAEVFEWNGRKLVPHDPFTGPMGVGTIYVDGDVLHVHAYPRGEGEPQRRCLTRTGEWKAAQDAPPAVPPAPGVVEPEERLP